MIIDQRIYVTVAALGYAVMILGIPIRGYRVWGIGVGVILVTALIAFLDWLWA